MAQDELATVAALDAARAVFRAEIEAHQGRTIDTAGDSVLAVFETAVGAVASALSIQIKLKLANEAEAIERRMHFRIGVHLGNFIEKHDGTAAWATYAIRWRSRAGSSGSSPAFVCCPFWA